MNTVILTGRLTQDPQQRSAGETEICDLRLAVGRRKGRDGADRGAVFIDVTTFNGLATVVGQYLTKGSRVAVHGRLELDEWQAQDGSPRRRHKVIAEQVEFLDPATSSDDQPRGDDELAARRQQSDEDEVDEAQAA